MRTKTSVVEISIHQIVYGHNTPCPDIRGRRVRRIPHALSITATSWIKAFIKTPTFNKEPMLKIRRTRVVSGESCMGRRHMGGWWVAGLLVVRSDDGRLMGNTARHPSLISYPSVALIVQSEQQELSWSIWNSVGVAPLGSFLLWYPYFLSSFIHCPMASSLTS